MVDVNDVVINVALSEKGSLQQILEKSIIEIERVRYLAFNGLNSEAEWRPVTWRILLGLISINSTMWTQELASTRKSYENLKCKYLNQSLYLNEPQELRMHLKKKDEALLKEIEKVMPYRHIYLFFF